MPAREAALDLSFQVAADPAGGFVLTDALDIAAAADGSVLIVEAAGRVDRVAPDGAITVAAPAADGLVPVAAAAQPLAPASRIWRVAPDGGVVFTDTIQDRDSYGTRPLRRAWRCRAACRTGAR